MFVSTEGEESKEIDKEKVWHNKIFEHYLDGWK